MIKLTRINNSTPEIKASEAKPFKYYKVITSRYDSFANKDDIVWIGANKTYHNMTKISAGEKMAIWGSIDSINIVQEIDVELIVKE